METGSWQAKATTLNCTQRLTTREPTAIIRPTYDCFHYYFSTALLVVRPLALLHLVAGRLSFILRHVGCRPKRWPNDEQRTSGGKICQRVSESWFDSDTIYGDEHKNRYLLETTGSGAAFIDYDNDGWQDIFLVNGTRLDGVPPNLNATNRLYRNNGNGTFTDVTEKAGLVRTGWGQSVCVGDYDNNGYDDLFISSYGKNALYQNNGNGVFTELAEKAGVANNARAGVRDVHSSTMTGTDRSIFLLPATLTST